MASVVARSSSSRALSAASRKAKILCSQSAPCCHLPVLQLLETATPYSCSRRLYAASTNATTSGDSDDNYVSPFADFFDMIARNETSLGQTMPQPEPRYLKCGVCEDALRFKTVSYGGPLLLAPYVPAGEHRVTLKVFLSDLPLNEMELQVMRQIVGSRVSEERNELRLTSDQFGSRIENKRHLVSMLDRIVTCSKQLAKEEGEKEVG